MPFEVFMGDNLEEWAQHFHFSEGFLKNLMENLGVVTLKDIYFVLTDEELLLEVEKNSKRLEYIKFKQSQELTVAFRSGTTSVKQENPDSARKRLELEEWIDTNKLANNLMEVLNAYDIFDLPSLLLSPNDLVESIANTLKPIPGRKFKQSLNITRDARFKPYVSIDPVPVIPPSISSEPAPVLKVAAAMNTAITFTPGECVLEDWYENGKKDPIVPSATKDEKFWKCHICAQLNKESVTKCKDCFTVRNPPLAPPPPPSPSVNPFLASSSLPLEKGLMSSTMPSGIPSVHVGVTCDECKMNPIVGVRYKCTGRYDYDLCEFCEAKKRQPHPMIKIVEPLKAGVYEIPLEPARMPIRPSSSMFSLSSSSSSLLAPLASDSIQLCWDKSLSNGLLHLTNENRTLERPGSVSCYPAGFVLLPSDLCEFNITIEKGALSSNWLTFGITKVGMANSSSDGFGKTQHSWGIRDDRGNSSLLPIISASGSDVGKMNRKLKAGDLLTMKVDVNNGIADLFVNHNEFSHRFTIPVGKSTDYWFGMTFANDHRVLILPSRRLSLIAPGRSSFSLSPGKF